MEKTLLTVWETSTTTFPFLNAIFLQLSLGEGVIEPD
jgi:hypothetical protein